MCYLCVAQVGLHTQTLPNMAVGYLRFHTQTLPPPGDTSSRSAPARPWNHAWTVHGSNMFLEAVEEEALHTAVHSHTVHLPLLHC